MTAVRAGIELSIKPPINAIRAESVSLTEYAFELSDAALAPLGGRRGFAAGTGRWSARKRTLTPALRRWPGGHRLPGAHVTRFGLSLLASTFAGVLAGVGASRAFLFE